MKQMLEAVVDNYTVLPEAMKQAAEREQLYRDTVLKEMKAMRYRQYLQIGIIVVAFLLLLLKK